MWLGVCAAIAWVQVRLAPLGPEPSLLLRAVGGVLIALGLMLIGLAAYEMARARTTIIPHLDPSQLVQSGIFAWSRNPIYLADAVILVGLCLRWGAYLSLVLVPIFMMWISRHFIRAEEARLRKHFGEVFDAYTQKVRRWL